MQRPSRLSMQKVRHNGGLLRKTLLICWERVFGSVILSCVACDARTLQHCSYICTCMLPEEVEERAWNIAHNEFIHYCEGSHQQ